MKPSYASMLLCATLVFAAQARATVLPDACGDDKIKFDVTTQKGQPAPAPPPAGKAQVVFIELVDKGNVGSCIGCNFTTRVGLDGAWVGANKGNSYFTLAVDPGEHHLCAGWQSVIGRMRSNVGVASFNAEAGKVYYYQIRIKDTPGEVTGSANGAVSSAQNWSLDVTQLSEDEGKYRVKISALATVPAKK